MWVPSYDYLEHHGIPGQKWGVRRFQYEDGTLTPQGKARYDKTNSYTNTSSNNNRSTSDSRGSNTGAVRKFRPSRKNNSLIGNVLNDVGSSLGFNKRKDYVDAKQEEYVHNNPNVTDYGEMAQENIDELMEKYNELGTYKMTDEDYSDYKFFMALLDGKNKKDKERKAKTDAILEEYKKTPLGWLETTFNQAVDTGKQFVDSASSSISDFFKNLF